MDFIFMLTRDDMTVPNCLDVFEKIRSVGVSHVGFKDVGVDSDTLAELAARIREAGIVSYLEVVSTQVESVRGSLDTAARIGIDRVLGGQETAYALEATRATAAGYYPFPGRPVGHPTLLEGSARDILDDCRRAREAGCPGVDLLAYRATQADPLDLVRAAREGTGDGYLIVAGSIDSPDRIHAIADCGADAFTIGTAIFNNRFAPGVDTLRGQCEAVLEACASCG